jgi:exopolysaccharide biosynthesis polyprenyl glycosylphosphotransferase
MVLGIGPAAGANTPELNRILRLARRPELGPAVARGNVCPTAQHLATNVAVRVTVSRPRWQLRYARCVVVTDLSALLLSAAGYRFWGSVPSFTHAQSVMAAAVVLAGAMSLHAARVWDSRVLGHGTEEFSRLLRAFVWVGVLTALAGLALKEPALRPYAFGVVPIALMLATGGRLLGRLWVGRLRRSGRCMRNVLVVGSGATVAPVIERARRGGAGGWSVTGVCLSDDDGLIRREDGGAARTVQGVPVLGGLDSVVDTVLRFGYHVVCVAPDTGWSSRRLHELTWDLEGTGTEIAVDPGLMEIASRRVVMCPVDGVPVLRLEEPAFYGLQRLTKAVIDRVGGLVLLVLLSPVLLAAAVAVRCSRGPVFYRQRRLGKNGEAFTMIKFRSMVVDADRMQAALADVDTGAGPMFKVRDDPRVTRAGRVLRRYSIDELPQLFNVLTGSMSLVGPRPPLPEEITSYDEAAHRRLLVRPGMTGLWQVSGRSDLSWVEAVRLDLTYVENWSLLTDALIVMRTVRAVLRGSGAY